MAISKAWWDDWWASDYSWEGLARKSWRGWVRPAAGGPCVEKSTGVAGEDATLQDYFRDRLGRNPALLTSPTLFPSPVSGKSFTRLHLPLQWENGTPTGKDDPQWCELAGYHSDLKFLLEAGEAPRTGDVRAGFGWTIDRNSQFSGAVLLDFDVSVYRSPDPRQDGRIPVSLSSKKAAFTGLARFQKAVFVGEAVFSNAAFSGYAGFTNAAFSDHAGFNNAVFSNNASFVNAAFSGYARFDNAAFSGDALFTDAAFFSDADFDSAAFSGNTFFVHAAFSRSIIFKNAIFVGEASFLGQGEELATRTDPLDLAISPPTDSKTTTWAGVVRPRPALTPRAFRAAMSANFEAAIFLDDADFSNRDILSPGKFDSVLFMGLARYHGSSLHQGTSFHGAVFEPALTLKHEPLKVAHSNQQRIVRAAVRILARWASSQYRRRGERILWQDALDFFVGHPMLGSLLKVGLDVRGGKPTNKRAKEAIPLDDGQDIEGLSIFQDIAAMSPRIVRAYAEIRRKAANRNRAAGPVDARIEDNKRFVEVELAFRTLKLAMENNRDRIEEGRFFRLELLARRRRWDVPLWERWASGAYEALADYGNSLFRPFVSLLISYLVFSLLFFGMGAAFDRWAPIVTTPMTSLSRACQIMVVEDQIARRATRAQIEACRPPIRTLKPVGKAATKAKSPAAAPAFKPLAFLNWPDGFAALTFSWNNIFRPLSALSAEGVAPYEPSWASAMLYGYGSGWGLLVRVLATLQSLLAIVIVFMLALAIRRRFQIT
jgi:hypothetical protein